MSQSTGTTPQSKNFVGRNAFHRINFLYQAAQHVSQVPGEAGTVLNAFYGQLLGKVAKKSVLRMDPTIKRTLCKGCGCYLNYGTSCVIRKKRKNGGTVKHSCQTCGTQKTFGLSEKLEPWHCKPESVHTTYEEKCEVVPSEEGPNKTTDT